MSFWDKFKRKMETIHKMRDVKRILRKVEDEIGRSDEAEELVNSIVDDLTEIGKKVEDIFTDHLIPLVVEVAVSAAANTPEHRTQLTDIILGEIEEILDRL